MVATTNLAVIPSGSGGFLQYLQEIRKFPILSCEEEYDCAVRMKEKGDLDAARVLISSHLRLVVKIATSFKSYGLPIADLVAEGNIGLMQAVKKFEPSKGFRLSTYAMWWIKAAIQEYILRSWSLVKIGTTAAQKKLFFNLRKIKNKILGADSDVLQVEDVKYIAAELDVAEDEVVEMDKRMSGGDVSLNDAVGGEDGKVEFIDMLASDCESQETLIADAQEKAINSKLLREAMQQLNERERAIIEARRLSENPATLEDLSQKYKISRERVRQIESHSLNKLYKLISAVNF